MLLMFLRKKNRALSYLLFIGIKRDLFIYIIVIVSGYRIMGLVKYRIRILVINTDL